MDMWRKENIPALEYGICTIFLIAVNISRAMV
jgi:hypothetical protein